MKAVVLFLLVVFYSASACSSELDKKPAPLIAIDSADYGDPKSKMKLVELERNERTSKIKLSYEKLGSSVGSSMFIMRAFYEIAKARGTEYFTNLKEWQEPDGSRIFIAGFTNTKDADIKKEFGEEFDYNNEYGQKRILMSISQLKTIFREPKKSIDPKD